MSKKKSSKEMTAKELKDVFALITEINNGRKGFMLVVGYKETKKGELATSCAYSHDVSTMERTVAVSRGLQIEPHRILAGAMMKR